MTPRTAIVLRPDYRSCGKTLYLRGMSQSSGPISTTDARQALRFKNPAEASEHPARKWPGASFYVWHLSI